MRYSVGVVFWYVWNTVSNKEMSLRCVRARGDVLLPLMGNPAGASILGLGPPQRDVLLLFEGRRRARVAWRFAMLHAT